LEFSISIKKRKNCNELPLRFFAFIIFANLAVKLFYQNNCFTLHSIKLKRKREARKDFKIQKATNISDELTLRFFAIFPLRTLR